MEFTLNDVTELPTYSPDRRYLALNTATEVQVYETSSYTLIETLEGYHFSEVDQGTWSPDSQHLIVIPLDSLSSRLGPCQVWTISESLSAPIYNLTGGLVWSPDSSQIAGASDYTKVRIYNAETGELLETIRDFPNGEAYLEAWSQHYLIIISGNYAFVGQVFNVWDTRQRTFVFQQGVDIALSYELDGNTLTLDQAFWGIQKINLLTRELLANIEFDRMLAGTSPNGHWLLGIGTPFEARDFAPIFVYRVDPYQLITTFEGSTEIMPFTLWSPDSHYFASIGEANNVIVWEIEAQED